MCEEHDGGDSISSQQPGDITLTTETKSHYDDSRVELKEKFQIMNLE